MGTVLAQAVSVCRLKPEPRSVLDTAALLHAAAEVGAGETALNGEPTQTYPFAG